MSDRAHRVPHRTRTGRQASRRRGARDDLDIALHVFERGLVAVRRHDPGRRRRTRGGARGRSAQDERHQPCSCHGVRERSPMLYRTTLARKCTYRSRRQSRRSGRHSCSTRGRASLRASGSRQRSSPRATRAPPRATFPYRIHAHVCAHTTCRDTHTHTHTHTLTHTHTHHTVTASPLMSTCVCCSAPPCLPHAPASSLVALCAASPMLVFVGRGRKRASWCTPAREAHPGGPQGWPSGHRAYSQATAAGRLPGGCRAHHHCTSRLLDTQ